MANNDDKFLLVSLDDEKSKAIAEVLSSPTCKKIINYLAENREASEKDLSDKLKSPLNTIEYNLKKLLSSGFVQKRKNFFWSRKGKKIAMYELSHKSILISHKKPVSKKIKSIVPAFILAIAGAAVLWVYGRTSSVFSASAENSACNLAAAGASQVSASISPALPVASRALDIGTVITSQPPALWFLFGAFIAILIISIVNWRKL